MSEPEQPAPGRPQPRVAARPGPPPRLSRPAAPVTAPAAEPLEPPSDPSAFGRVDDDGTVYVRTADGERPVGSWKAGPPELGLAFFGRRYDEFATEVSLLERRLAAGTGDAAAIRASAARHLESLPAAPIVGDVPALEARLRALLAAADTAVDAARARRAEEAAAAVAAKEALAAEAERLGQSSDWKVAGERLRTIGDDWRAITGVDRRTDARLWRQVAAARAEFHRRRSAHFAALDEQRKASAERKDKLVARAEELAGSTDWGAAAAGFRDLMAEWKRSGRAAKAADDALWERFRAAQDRFFAARAAVHAERDEGLRANQQAKEALLAEAEALDVSGDLTGSTRRLREIQQRWEAAGRVPRDTAPGLERRMAAVEERVRAASDARWRQANVATSPLVIRLEESVAKLEARVRRFRAAGQEAEAAKAEEALATQREWLAQARRGA